MDAPTYEVLALRYATHQNRSARENFIATGSMGRARAQGSARELKPTKISKRLILSPILKCAFR